MQANQRGYLPFDGIDDPESSCEHTADSHHNGEVTSKDVEDEEVEELNEFPSPPPPGFTDPAATSELEIDSILVYLKGYGTKRSPKVVSLKVTLVHIRAWACG